MEAEEYERIYQCEMRHFWYRGLHDLVLGAIRRHAPSGRRLRVLDAGCGTGGLMSHLAAGHDVIGFDYSGLAIDFARRRGFEALARGSIDRPPVRAESMDVVTSMDVLSHAAVVDDVAAVSELRDVLRPGGLLLLNLAAHPWLWGAHDKMVHNTRRYSRAQVRRLASAAGFQVIRLCWYNCTLFPLVVLIRKLVHTTRETRSDVGLPPRIVNGVLRWLMSVEAWLTLRVPLPWGLSIFCILRKT